MNRSFIFLIIISFLAGCGNQNESVRRIPVAKAGKVILYYDQMPSLIDGSMTDTDSIAVIKNYINKWGKRELLSQIAEANLTPVMKSEIESQLAESRTDLFIYQYQRQMLLEKMDTLVNEDEIRNYYATNETSFVLSSNIVKARIIKLPVETPDINKIRSLTRSETQADIQELEKLCYQFAEKFDDFNEEWVTMSRLMLEIPADIGIQENFLRRNTFFETSDSSAVYFITIRDYRLRSSLAPYEYVKDDIKRTIWNNRRLEFLQSLENGIYNEALKDNSFKIY